MADPKAPHKITQIDEKKRLCFLEWFSNARFECSKESKYRYVCRDPDLHKNVNDLFEGIYEKGFKYTAWRDQGEFRVINPSGSAEIVIISGTPRLKRSNAILQPGSITEITNSDALTPPLNCIYVFDAVRILFHDQKECVFGNENAVMKTLTPISAAVRKRWLSELYLHLGDQMEQR
ncbi:hypothetical protein McanCB56680_007493 [Microsporum canis]